MSQLEDHHRKMIERTLGRSLLEEELREAPTLDALSDAQLAVINKLSRLQIIAYLNYLRAVVPHVTMAQATEFMNHIQRVMVPPRD